MLLGQPRGKERPRGTRAGHFYTPEKTRSYEAALKYAAAQEMGARAPIEGPVSVELRVVVPIAASWPKKRQIAAVAGQLKPTKKPDLDNILKMLDALNLVVWVDDAQVVEARIIKSYGDKPGIWILVRPMEGTAT